MSRRFLINFLRVLFYGTLLYFLGRVLVGFDWSVIQSIEIDMILIVWASILALIFRFFSAGLWQLMLSPRPQKLGFFERLALLNAYSVSWVSRYFPGGLVSLGTRVYLSSKVGFKAIDVTAISILEVLFQVVALVVITILFLGEEIDFVALNDDIFWLISVVVFSMFVFLFPVLCGFIDKISNKLMGVNVLVSAFRFSRPQVALYLTGYLFAGFIVGASYYLLLFSIYEPLPLDAIWFIIGIVAFSGVVSIFSIFAPGGLGVREGILIIFLVQVVPKEIAISLAVLSRFWGIFLDILFFSIVKIGIQLLNSSPFRS